MLEHVQPPSLSLQSQTNSKIVDIFTIGRFEKPEGICSCDSSFVDIIDY